MQPVCKSNTTKNGRAPSWAVSVMGATPSKHLSAGCPDGSSLSRSRGISEEWGHGCTGQGGFTGFTGSLDLTQAVPLYSRYSELLPIRGQQRTQNPTACAKCMSAASIDHRTLKILQRNTRKCPWLPRGLKDVVDGISVFLYLPLVIKAMINIKSYILLHSLNLRKDRRQSLLLWINMPSDENQIITEFRTIMTAY